MIVTLVISIVKGCFKFAHFPNLLKELFEDKY